MATSHHKKRKSSEEKHDELEGAKRKKKSSRDGSRGRRAKGSGRSSRSKAPAKVHSVSELVKLVMSGEIKVPKCLGHYVEDSNQLLDQVFTILPESDVKGMLPDILKGLRLRHVKQLCLEQLKKMSKEDIMDIIEPREKKQELNLDAAVFELMGEQGLSGNASGTGSGSVEEGRGEGRKGDGGGGGRGGEGEGGGGRGEQRRGGEGEGGGGKGCIEGGASQAGTSHLSEHNPPLTEYGNEREKKRLCVSDMSGDEVMDTTAEMQCPRPSRRSDSSRPETMECDTTTEESVAVQVCGEQEEEEEEEEEGQGASDDADDGRGSHSDTGSSCSLEDFWLCDFPEEVSELARLQEIEFRRRALEAELRKSQLEQGGEESAERKEVGEEARLKVMEPDPSSSVKIDKMEALELQMRQRALQSLLAKKKQHHQ